MLLFSADPTIFFLAHGELKKPPSKVAYFSSCWTVSVCTSKNDSICPAKKVYGSFELFGGHVMEQLLASKCTKIRVGGGAQLSPCSHQSSAGLGCWLPSTPTPWWRCSLMTSNCAFAGAAKSSQKLADLLIIFLLSFKTQRFQDLENCCSRGLLAGPSSEYKAKTIYRILSKTVVQSSDGSTL